VLDFRAKTIWYGDSLQWEIEPKLRSVLEWWTEEHGSVRFTYQRLPITHQNDSFSCGLLAWNALAHFFLPFHRPLIDPADVVMERLRVLLCICERHHKNVS
jgi:hypothetical protein